MHCSLQPTDHTQCEKGTVGDSPQRNIEAKAAMEHVMQWQLVMLCISGYLGKLLQAAHAATTCWSNTPVRPDYEDDPSIDTNTKTRLFHKDRDCNITSSDFNEAFSSQERRFSFYGYDCSLFASHSTRVCKSISLYFSERLRKQKMNKNQVWKVGKRTEGNWSELPFWILLDPTYLTFGSLWQVMVTMLICLLGRSSPTELRDDQDRSRHDQDLDDHWFISTTDLDWSRLGSRRWVAAQSLPTELRVDRIDSPAVDVGWPVPATGPKRPERKQVSKGSCQNKSGKSLHCAKHPLSGFQTLVTCSFTFGGSLVLETLGKPVWDFSWSRFLARFWGVLI